MKKILILLSLIFMTLTTDAADALPAGQQVQIETSMGPIRVLLYDDTPEHQKNFLKHVDENYYDSVLFHRVIKDFMVQAGDPASKTATPDQMLGAGDPGYTLPAEFRYPQHFHKYGALAAARTGDQVNPERRSSGAQFYIVTGRKYNAAQLQNISDRQVDAARQSYFQKLCVDNRAEIEQLMKEDNQEALEALRQKFIAETEANVSAENYAMPAEVAETYETIGGTPSLDGQYTVFGEVLEGMDTVEKIQNAATGTADRPVEDIRIISMKRL